MQYDHQFEMALNYQQFSNYAENLLTKLSSDDTYSMQHNAKVDLHILQKVKKTAVISEELCHALQSAKPLILVILTEGYCGDSAQTFPVFAKMQEMFPDKIEIKVILRDEHLDIADMQFESRAIPTVVGFDRETLTQKFVWGNRPKPAQKIMDELKAKNATQDEKGIALHKWYAADKTNTLQNELIELLNT